MKHFIYAFFVDARITNYIRSELFGLDEHCKKFHKESLELLSKDAKAKR